jgi:ABC-type transport system substrate-binding protein
MTNGAAGAAAGSAGAAVIAQAIKASGAIVNVEPNDFIEILARSEKPLVVCAQGWFLKTNFQYLTSYKGLVFFTKSPQPLPLPDDAESISAKRIWIPG